MKSKEELSSNSSSTATASKEQLLNIPKSAMAFTSNSLQINTSHTSISPLHSRRFPLQKRLRNWEFRVWRRRRVKLNPKLNIRNELNPPSPFEDFFQNFLSSLPNPLTSQKLIPPAALGFASGLALSISKLNSKANSSKSRVCEVGEWILFTSPTPFNRFVMLRCPTITFEGSEFLENVNDKLVKEERHYVRLDSGIIQASDSDEDIVSENHHLEYQRVCVGTDDGGVISLDWPANLDLNEERGLDTTFLLIPGTAEGSMDEDVRAFVRGCLKRGFFPVVMNPRGCAGSPLTTARLFTAADSDDICSAVQFLNRARPWSTLMGVGWGYGANMLTKYLAEVGEKTPLTAATCIDNPFDLEEATRTSSHQSMFDEKLTRGLTNILKSNKALFQGRSNDFNVEEALSAESVRDFETAISMVSYGFDNINDFYSMSSTRSMVGDLKIPVLFIQNDNGAVPLFSIPRGLIAENPYTSLILCSCLPSAMTASSKSVSSWCQQLTIEWLTAVELGLLKGRHPLLQDVDVTINPSKGLALVEGRTSERIGVNVLNFTEPESSKRFSLDPMKDMSEEHDSGAAISVPPPQGSNSNLAQSSALGVEPDSDADPEDIDKGQVLQTAQVVMNMLDVAMPDTLQEEEKKKVLDAVGQGETLVKALQDAVPDDVRGKLTASVSEILHVQGKSLNFDGLAGIGQISKGPSRLKFKVEEEVGKQSSTQNNLYLDQKRTPNDMGDDHVDREATDNTSSRDNNDNQTQEKSPASLDPSTSQPSNSHEDDVAVMKKGVTEPMNIPDTNESAKESVPQQSDENSSETSFKAIVSGHNETPSQYEEASVNQGIKHEDGQTGSLDIEDKSIVMERDERRQDASGFKQVNKHEDGDTSQLDIKDESNILGREEKQQDSSGFKRETKQEDGVADPLDVSNMSGREQRRQDSSGPKLDIKHEDGAIGQQDIEGEHNTLDKEGKHQDSSENQNKANSSTNLGEVISHPNSSGGGSEKTEDGRNRDGLQPIPDQNNPAPDVKAPSFSVSQALDALTGMDDSTQVAVNSVFGVIENMIDQLEEANKDGKITNEESNSDDDISSNSTDKNSVSSEHQLEEPKDGKCFEGLWPPGIMSVGKDNFGGAFKDKANGIARQEDNHQSEKIVVGKLIPKNSSGQRNVDNLPTHLTTNAHTEAFYNEHLRKYILCKVQTAKPLDLDETSALFLDYIPEEGQWKMLEHPGGPVHISSTVNYKRMKTLDSSGSLKKKIDEEKIIEPSYVIVDSERRKELVEEFETAQNMKSQVVSDRDGWDALTQHVKNIVMESLKLEVSRRLGAEDIKEMDDAVGDDIEAVANAICSAIRQDKENTWHFISSDVDQSIQELSRFQSEQIVEAISLVVKDTGYLRRVLPIGVIVGSCLASLRKYFYISVLPDNDGAAVVSLKEKGTRSKPKAQPFEAETVHNPSVIGAQNTVPVVQSDAGRDNEFREPVGLDKEQTPVNALSRDAVMVGAVTAAIGASAFITHQQDALRGSEIIDTSSKSSVKKELLNNESVKVEEATDDQHQNNVVTSLAEKAMSVAAPMVPTKEGEVDQERLVSMLAELGQKGGVLKLVGKIALLWGGVRGAISLTDRLITFLRLSERPLFHRVVGFVSMVVILWSPVVVPLLPTIVQNWTTRNSSRIVELVCITGLYTAVTILIILWGKRIRRHENPLRQYGLDFSSSQKVPDFLTGLAGGVMLVLSIHSINAFLGYAHYSWPVNLIPSSIDLVARLKAYSQILLLTVWGIVTATCVAFVEELLFRSWLPEEIAADLGYHRGIIISGLIFSLSQRSLHSIPGLWLLSLCLAGVRQRNHGQLFIPVGLRSGIVATSILLHIGGFLTYQTDFPIWLTGHPFQPFSGLIGLLCALSLAIVLYPREQSLWKRIKRTIRE